MKYFFPKGLPLSKQANYLLVIQKKYDKIIKFINKLGNIITYDQFIRLYKLSYPNLSDSYADKKARNIIKEMQDLKLIECKKLNTYKYFHLKKFAFAIIQGDYKNCKLPTMNTSLKNNNFKMNLIKVEYYLDNKEIISTLSLNNQLLIITNDIYKLIKQDQNLRRYNIALIENILKYRSPDRFKEELERLEDGNIIKILWVNLYNIFNSLRLQNQTISTSPFYYKIFKINNKLYLHYVPEIIIFDVHNKKYYINKLNDLFYKFYNIQGNVTTDLRNYYKNKGTLGYEGFNHIAYSLSIIGTDTLELNHKRKTIQSKINDNPNGIIISLKTYVVDISKYFRSQSKDTAIYESIDTNFNNLMSKKLQSL